MKMFNYLVNEFYIFLVDINNLIYGYSIYSKNCKNG